MFKTSCLSSSFIVVESFSEEMLERFCERAGFVKVAANSSSEFDATDFGGTRPEVLLRKVAAFAIVWGGYAERVPYVS